MQRRAAMPTMHWSCIMPELDGEHRNTRRIDVNAGFGRQLVFDEIGDLTSA